MKQRYQPVRRHQRGQALTESVVLLIVLVPLAIAIEQLSRLAMVQHQLISSVRHVLLETYFSPLASTTTAERFSGPASAMTTHLKHLAGTDALPHPRYEWSDKPLTTDDVSLDWNTTLLATLESVSSNDFLREPEAAKQLAVTLPLVMPHGIGQWLQGRSLQYEESLTLLTDAWQVDGNAMLAARVGSFSVAAQLAEIAEPIRAVSRVLSIIEPSFDRFCPGRLVLETVPEDRLSITGGRFYDFRKEPC